jgi:predicted aminopeptidase
LRRLLLLLLLVLVSLGALSGCLQVCYLAQAVEGQDEIQYRARPIPEVLADPATSGRLLRLLPLVAKVKRFGEQMGLAPTPNYETYVALDRPVATWVVVAAPPLRLRPKTWWFPVVGSVPYLGWFERGAAEAYAATLRQEGYDVHVRGASAYSTLGWFSDPILSSMLHPNPELAAAGLIDVVLHESVHATHYVASQSYFNESLANFVAAGLTPRFIREHLPHADALLERWRKRKLRREQRRKRLAMVYKQLSAIYRSPAPAAQRLARKRALLRSLDPALGRLNNALLAQVRTYGSGDVAFQRLLRSCGGNWKLFLQRIKTIDAAAFRQPQQVKIGPVVEAAIQQGRML